MTTMMNSHHTEDIRKTLQKWILDTGTRRDPQGPNADADLIQEGWIDSLGLMSLISQVEDMLGRPLEDDEMRMQNFVSIDNIIRNLFKPARA
jgi:acyl carrier protein